MRDGKGVIEYLKKSGTGSTKGEVSFYFYKNPTDSRGDLFEPWDSLPESAELVLGKNRIPLEVEDEAFVTPSGPILFADKEIDGQLSIVVDGETIVTPLHRQR